MASGNDYEIPDTGAVFTFGRSRFAENLSSHFFVRNDPVLEISCGDEHTALVCGSGRVFLFGKNDFGQLGFGHTQVVNKPSCLKYLKPFKSIHVACGKSHTLVATACGRLFAFGCNSDGQLGLGDLTDRTMPQMVPTALTEDDGGIAAVAAGCHHSALLTGKGVLYMWGNNSDGQCGVKNDKQFLTPQKIDFQNPISVVSCGYYHTAFISLGNVYTFGEDDNGKLGHPDKLPNDVPERVEIEENCVMVKCGGSHTIALTESGKVFAFGSNFSGQLGVGGFEPEFSVPQPVQFPVENLKLSHISCGESHSAFISETGELYTCGDARNGKLCNEDDLTNLNLPTRIETFQDYICTSVSCGGCHTMVLAKAQKSDSDDAKAILPPVKLKKAVPESETDGKTMATQEPTNNLSKSNTDTEESNNKSNSQSNLNETVNSHEDDIYSEISESQVENDKGVDVGRVLSGSDSSKESKESQVEKESDPVVVQRKDSTIKKLLNKLKWKKRNSKVLTDEKTDEKRKLDINVKVEGHQTSKACIIL